MILFAAIIMPFGLAAMNDNKFIAMSGEELTKISDTKSIIQSMNEAERAAFIVAYNQKLVYEKYDRKYTLTNICVEEYGTFSKEYKSPNSKLTIYPNEDKSSIHSEIFKHTDYTSISHTRYDSRGKCTYERNVYPGLGEEATIFD